MSKQDAGENRIELVHRLCDWSTKLGNMRMVYYPPVKMCKVSLEMQRGVGAKIQQNLESKLKYPRFRIHLQLAYYFRIKCGVDTILL